MPEFSNAPTLGAVLKQYLAAHFLTAQSAEQLAVTLRRFEHYAGQVRVDEMTDEMVSGFLHTLVGTHAASTINAKRRQILMLWTWGWKHRLCETPPRDVPKVPGHQSLPDSWSPEEVGLLLDAAKAWPGQVGDCAAGDWWVALIQTVWWTASRIGALLQVCTEDYDPETGGIILRKTKSGREEFHRLHIVGQNAIRRIYNPQRTLLFAWPYSSDWLWVVFRKIAESAGIPVRRVGRQLFHKLRRSALTEAWKHDPAFAQRLAGHVSPQTTWKSYIDPRRLQDCGAAEILPVPRSI